MFSNGLWAIRPDVLPGIIEKARSLRPEGAISSKPSGGGDVLDERYFKVARVTRLEGGVASISMHGPIFCRETIINRLWSEIFGGVVLEQWTRVFASLVADPEVTAIVLDIDSPGGEVAGTSETAAAIRAAASKKPVWAHTTGLACSAAYWIASAAREVWVDRTAHVGSIGVAWVIVDDSEAYARAGVRMYEFTAEDGPLKRPDVSTPEGAELFQEVVDATGRQFISEVAKYRGVSAAKVRSDFGRGWLKSGQEAVDAGMADAVGTSDQMLSALLADMRKSGGKGTKRAALGPMPGRAATLASL